MKRTVGRGLTVFVVSALGVGLVGSDQPIPSGAPRVRLLEAGRSPLRTLRYKATAGQKGSITMTQKMAIEMTIGGQTLPSSGAPEIRLEMDYTVATVSPEGDIRFEFRLSTPELVGGPEVPPAATQAMRTALEGMRGLSGHGLLASHGLMRDVQFVLPENANAQLRQLVDQMQPSLRNLSAPFPLEAVGVGGKWEIIQRVTLNGVTLDQTGTNELTSLEGDRGQLAVKVTQSAEPQQVQLPNLPPQARMDLESMVSKGEGEVSFDLSRLVPTKARMTIHTDMKARFQVGKEAQTMGMKMDASVSVAGR